MKKLLSLVLSVLIIAALAGCNTGNTPAVSPYNNTNNRNYVNYRYGNTNNNLTTNYPSYVPGDKGTYNTMGPGTGNGNGNNNGTGGTGTGYNYGANTR